MVRALLVGIKGKEDADRLAKQAVEEEMVGIEIPYMTEIKSMIMKKSILMWQRYLSNETNGRHLYSIKEKGGSLALAGMRLVKLVQQLSQVG